MKKILRLVLIVLLAVITAVSVYMYIIVEQEKNTLMNSLKQAELQVESLEADKQVLLLEASSKAEVQQGLTQKKEELEKELQLCEDKFSEFDAASQDSQAIVEQLNAELSALKIENASIKTENSYLKTTNGSLSNEIALLKTGKGIVAPGQK